MDSTNIIKRVKKIEIRTKHLVEGLLQGSYHSVFKGRGIEFSEVREYTPGDDIRIIDWKVTSRMNEPFVKEFIEERDLDVYILFDISGSNEFGSSRSKKESALELSASLMFAAMKNNDNVGLCMFSDKVEKFIPAKKGKRHVLRTIRDLVHTTPGSNNTDLNAPLRFISKILKKKGIIFIISDFMTPEFSKNLSILKKRHDIVAVNINDPREQEIPDVGYIEVEDEETGETLLVNSSDPEFQENYKKIVEERNNKLKHLLNKLNIDMINIRNNESFEIPMKRFFRMRERRISR